MPSETVLGFMRTTVARTLTASAELYAVIVTADPAGDGASRDPVLLRTLPALWQVPSGSTPWLADKPVQVWDYDLILAYDAVWADAALFKRPGVDRWFSLYDDNLVDSDATARILHVKGTDL